jgi:hypothetical protein
MPTRYPPKGDPRRPIELAVNAARTLGVVSILIGVLFGCIIGFLGGLGGPSTAATVVAVAGIALAAMYLVPGVLYLVFAAPLRRYRFWPAIVLLVMASLHTLVVALGFVGSVMGMLTSDDRRSPADGLGMLVFLAAFLVVGVLLIVYLCQSLGPLRRFEVERNALGHGFQPLMPPGTQPAPVHGPPQTVLPVYPPPDREQS